MRSLVLAASVALALGSVCAVAQTPRVTTANTSGPSTGTSTLSTSTSTSTSTAAGTTTSTLPSATIEATTTAPPSTGTPTNSSTSTGTSSTVGGGASNAFGTNTTTIVPTNSTPSFGQGGPFSNDSGNTALGTSAGQSSSGTAAGNSSSGLGAGSATLDPAGTVGNPIIRNPDGTLPGTAGVLVGQGATTNGVVQPGASPSFTIINTPTVEQAARTNTPIFDQVAREGRAKEQARKARGDEPRVYGIAPRTENDLTHQMPDDKIIRY